METFTAKGQPAFEFCTKIFFCPSSPASVVHPEFRLPPTPVCKRGLCLAQAPGAGVRPLCEEGRGAAYLWVVPRGGNLDMLIVSTCDTRAWALVQAVGAAPSGQCEAGSRAGAGRSTATRAGAGPGAMRGLARTIPNRGVQGRREVWQRCCLRH